MTSIRDVIRGENHIDFVRLWRKGLVLSLALVLISLGSLALRGLNLSVDFTGGVQVEVLAPGVSTAEANAALDEAGITNRKVQIVGADTVRVQTTAESEELQIQLRTVVAGLAQADVEAVSVSAVSPSWGEDITRQAFRALVFFLLAIFLYLTVRLEWRMAAAALVAVAHDVIISIGVYSLFQFEVGPGTVIAFLTILGYSIYDTVVVFDKVKENEYRATSGNRVTYTEMVAISMNTVLLRSLNTTITSLLPVLSLLFVGAGVLGAVALGQYAIALAVGLVVGAYSSIMVAGPVLAAMKEREPRYVQLRERVDAARLRTVAPPVDADGPLPTSAAAAPRPSGAAPIGSPTGVIPPRPRKKTRR